MTIEKSRVLSFILSIILLLPLGCAHSSHGEKKSDAFSLYIKKSIVMDGSSVFFSEAVLLPCDASRCNEPADPATWREAAEQLRAGLPSSIRHALMTAFVAACGGAGSLGCDVASPELWDLFYEEASHIHVESSNTLAQYTSRLNYALADLWRVDNPCVEEARLFASISRLGRASPDMQMEVIVRAAILLDLGREFDEADLVRGMGGMIQERGQVHFLMKNGVRFTYPSHTDVQMPRRAGGP